MQLNENRKLELLETLQAKVGCMYISDLLNNDFFPNIHQALEEMTYESFSLWEWNDAIRYITGQDITFAEPAHAHYFLLGFTESKRRFR